MTPRAAVTDKILAAKRRLNLSWSTIATTLGSGSIVFYTAALLGQFPLTAEEAGRAVALFELDGADAALLVEIPTRGEATLMPPTDPTIYRFYELVQSYGPTWKQLIHEEFGDGIMSAIDFNMSLEREPDPKGDRVHMVLSGKYLAYKTY